MRRDPGGAHEIERRFKRELLLARQVTHKNVVRIHDLGEIDGIKYITMPYIEGDDLATVLKRDGQLPRAARAARSRARWSSGLQAAHEAGVVHRDLKPANIMIDADDEAMIMDFGIARSSGGPAETSARQAAVRRSCRGSCSGCDTTQADARRARSSARWSTWRPSRRAARASISAPTSTPSA